MQWQNVYIFISSTFNDMHAERDYLVKSVFPALAEWCEARKLRLIDIDLRWGVTAADAEAKNTVRACLRSIDECRPFFLCFLGQRRGWIPDAADIGDDTYELFPELLAGQYAGVASVTEMEILHALIDPLHNGTLRNTKDDSRSGQAVDHAFFFLRDPEYLEKLPHPDLRLIYTNAAEREAARADAELARWRKREIPKTKRPVFSYSAEWNLAERTPEIALSLIVPTTAPQDSAPWQNAFSRWKAQWSAAGVAVNDSGEITGSEQAKAKAYNADLTSGRLGNFQVDGQALAVCIIEQLKDAISRQFPQHMAAEEQTPLQKELDQQAQILRLASEGFIRRAGDFDSLKEYLQNSERRPLAITADAGAGKTSLLAHFIDTYHTPESESLHYRFIGGSDDSVNSQRLVRSLLWELKAAGKIDGAIPADAAEMMNRLPELLAEAGNKGKTILVIDGLNQLESGMDDLYWIPTDLPGQVKMVVSFKLGEESADAYCRRQAESGAMILRGVKPFANEADRKALVTAYLEQYLKELDAERIQALVNSEGAQNPLFLKAILAELRVFGVHNDLMAVIRTRFGTTPVTAFDAILARMESDPAYTKISPAVALPRVFGWIAHSRYGLSVDELADLLVLEKLIANQADARDAVYLMIRQLRPFLARRDGRVDFFYESFKIAATKRYTLRHPQARSGAAWHKSLAAYFERLPLANRHRLMEQAWQYAHAGDGEGLKELLLNDRFMAEKIRRLDTRALIADYDLMRLCEGDLAAEELDALVLVQNGLMLSESFIGAGPEQLRYQLLARLFPIHNQTIVAFVAKLMRDMNAAGGFWFKPVLPGLIIPALQAAKGLDARKCRLLADKKRILLETMDGQVCLMDLTNESKRHLGRHSIYGFSEDNRYCLHEAHKNADPLVRLTSLSDFSVVELPAGPLDPTSRVMAAAGDTLVTADAIRGLTIWKISSGKLISSVPIADSKPEAHRIAPGDFSLKLSESGGRVVYASDVGEKRFYDLRDTANGALIRSFDANQMYAQVPSYIKKDLRFVFLAGGEQLLSCLVEHGQGHAPIIRWDVNSGAELCRYDIFGDFPKILISPDARRMLCSTSTFPGKNVEVVHLKLFDLESGQELFSREESSCSAAFSEEGDHIVVARANGTIVLIDFCGETMQEIKTDYDDVTGFQTASSVNTLLIETSKQLAMIKTGWQEGALIPDLDSSDYNLQAQAISLSKGALWACSKTGSILKIDALSGKAVEGPRVGQGNCRSLDYFAAEHLLLLSYSDVAEVLRADTGDSLHRLSKLHLYGAHIGMPFNNINNARFVNEKTVAYTAGGKIVVCHLGSGENTVLHAHDNDLICFDVLNEKQILTVAGNREAGTYAPKSNREASGGSRIKIWDIVEGKCIFDFHGCADNIVAACMTPDKTKLAAIIGKDKYNRFAGTHLKIWDIGGAVLAETPIKGIGERIAIGNKCDLLFSATGAHPNPCVLKAFRIQTGETVAEFCFDASYTGDRLFYEEETRTLSCVVDGKVSVFQCVEAETGRGNST